ncbi:plasmid transfer protein TraB [Streptomyces sp. NBC_00264]|uniref:plasmid transfer protein TraB n=1 Tax=unclassified Streptomyces TaxID=2593676 RepID=UPI00224D7735|nr:MULTISPECIES: plasmid transfer protein TraB [unclassified Streptomyces]MCX5166378.1 plasmid transfer protein TraB [Streptomyces sp. NBC_00305]MCX5166399.1 plasmid transfer protein TraB [Streptomyces sp. NBC_00305]MCX5224896.1 plasmid transfer protein TraB [Streptomyces sp. NBC_00264]
MNRTTDQHTIRRGSSGVGTYLLHRAMPHLPPWLGVAGVGIVGSGAHLMWADSVGAGVGLTLSAVALTGATWWAGRETSAQRRLHSAITVAAGSAWATGAALAGPLAGILPDTYLMGGVVLALSWNVRMALRTSDAPAATESADKGLLAKVGLAKALIGKTQVEPNRVTAAVALEGGEQTNDDVARALVRIASALDLPQSAVRYQPSADSARRGELVIVPKDMLGETVEWEGPSLPGGSIADPLVIGQYDDGSPLMVWLPGDPEVDRNAQHFLVAGGTGSGKGDAALNLQTEILSRRDVIMWLSDPKSFQDFRPLLPAYDWAVEGGAGTEAMVEALQHVIPARTGWLGKHSYRQWTTQAAETQTDPAHSCRPDRTPCGCEGMPYMVAWMEEAANTLRNLGDDAFTGIAQEARSAGVSLIVSLQRPSFDQMSTSTRASLPSVIALGCDPRDEGFSLPESVINQGAHPGAWGNRRPGYCYVVAGGIDPERYAAPGRTRQFTTRAVSLMETLAQWTVRNGATADPITAGAAKAVVGRAYTGRRADTDEMEQTAVPDQDDAIQTGSQLDPEDAAMDPEAELPTAQQGDDVPLFGQDAGRKPSPDEARELFARALDDFEAAGQMVVGPKDFMDWCDSYGYSRPWVSERLRDAAAEGRLQPTTQTGRWRIVPALTPA